ncbi:hypothetical protein HDU97_006698, partial [Phlyctochytrium planicorne]
AASAFVNRLSHADQAKFSPVLLQSLLDTPQQKVTAIKAVLLNLPHLVIIGLRQGSLLLPLEENSLVLSPAVVRDSSAYA